MKTGGNADSASDGTLRTSFGFTKQSPQDIHIGERNIWAAMRNTPVSIAQIIEMHIGNVIDYKALTGLIKRGRSADITHRTKNRNRVTVPTSTPASHSFPTP